MGRKKKGDLSTPNIDRFLQETGDVLTVADSMRKRQWFLTINESASCYKNFDDVVVSYGEKGSGFYHYAYILHDKDTLSEKAYNDMLDKACENEDISLFDRACGYLLVPESERTPQCYAYKPPHYHLLMCFENARTWSSIKNHFSGAHVQSCLSIVNSFRYLTHDTKDAIARGKTKYDIESVVFSPRGLEFFSNMQGEEVNFDYFDANKIAKYVWLDDMDSFHDFLLRFGANQVQRWMASINTECNLKKEIMMFKASYNGKACGRNKFCMWDKENGLIFLQENEIREAFGLNASSVKLSNILSWLEKINLSDYGKNYYTVLLYYKMNLSDLERYFICKSLPKYARKFGIKRPVLDIDTVKDMPFANYDDDFQIVVNY